MVLGDRWDGRHSLLLYFLTFSFLRYSYDSIGLPYLKMKQKRSISLITMFLLFYNLGVRTPVVIARRDKCHRKVRKDFGLFTIFQEQ